MLQIIFIHSFAKKHGLQYCVPYTVENPHIPNKGAYIFPGINYSDPIPELTIWKEPHFHFSEIPKIDNVCFYGFFQSWRYGSEYIDEIRTAFNFNYETKYDVIAIHRRSGDYKIQQQNHPVVSDEYLSKAIIHCILLGYQKFKFFSDDIGECKNFVNTYWHVDGVFEFSENKTEIEDFQEMINCAGIIGSNSTYSLMAAILKKDNGLSIFPSVWFGNALPHDTKDLIPPQFIVI